jgi:hypothetical protein
MTSGPRASRSEERTRRPRRVLERELGRDRANGQNVFFDAAGEQLFNRALADGKPLRLHQLPGVGGDLVELVLQGSHFLAPVNVSNS